MAPYGSLSLRFTHAIILLLLATFTALPMPIVTANPLPDVPDVTPAPEDYESIFEASHSPPSPTETNGPSEPTPSFTITPTPETTAITLNVTDTALKARGEGHAMGKRSFVYTCFPPFSISGSIFTGKCQKIDGSYIMSSLNLNKCVANANGYLVWTKNGNFRNTCPWTGIFVDIYESEYLGEVRLRADCEKIGGGLRYSELGLDSHVHNQNGQLSCGV